MAKYDEKINKYTDWGGDISTRFLKVKGGRIQEFIKEQLEKKAGEFYYDPSGKYLIFADTINRDLYLEDPSREDLLLGSFDAPSNYTASIELENPLYNIISLGSSNNYLDFAFNITNKSGNPTGEDVLCTYTFKKGTVVTTVTEQYNANKNVHFNIDKYITEGLNSITISIYGKTSFAATSIGLTYQVVNLNLETNYNLSQVFNLSEGTQVLVIPYTVEGSSIKIVEWYLDSEQLDFVKDEDEILESSASRVKYINLINLIDGVHNIQIRVQCNIGGELFYSDTHYYEFFVDNGNLNTANIAIEFKIPSKYGIIETPILYELKQYVPYELHFAGYNSNESIDLYINDQQVATTTLKNGIEETLTIIPKISGNAKLKFMQGNTLIKEYDAIIGDKVINVNEITSGLVLDFNTEGRTNNAENKDTWSFENYTGTFNNFSWNENSGWTSEGLYINNGASFEINYAPLATSHKNYGRTIEIDFKVVNKNSDNVPILDITNNDGTGLLITSNNISLTSRAGIKVESFYKDGEDVRVAFVLNPSSSGQDQKLTFLYINGKYTRAEAWTSTDNYIVNKNIKFEGSEDAEIILKNIRVYDTVLNSDSLLNNYMLYQKDVHQMNSIYDRNDIYEEGSLATFDPIKMASRLPVMIITGDIPTLENTDNKKTQITVDIEYINMQDPTKSFKMSKAAMTPQGTSSMAYPKKNFKIYTEKLDNTIVYDSNDNIIESKLYSFKDGAQPVNTWCLKADYAESSGTHNTGIARLWNDVLKNAKINGEYVFRTEAQNAAIENGYNYDVRTTVDGFPILMFYRRTPNDSLIFIGKYNFNNDKSTESVFGFRDIPGFDNTHMQCWEVLDNGKPLGLFTTAENFDNIWDEAFESRYPDSKTPYTGDLKAFCEWMSAVSQEDFALQKHQHLDVYKVAAYYVYLMRFGAVDQTVKNAMFTSEDGVKFYFINYDNDTINGLTNNGRLVTPWNANRETTDISGNYIFAGHSSRLWNFLEADEEFMTIVRQVDAALFEAGLTYDNAIRVFDTEQADKWVERVYNQDSQYKYIGPFTNPSLNINNLFMLQGDRSQHRKYWLAKRFGLYDSIFVSGDYVNNSISLKCSNDTSIGQQFSIVAGTDMGYGYGVNSLPRETNINLLNGESHTFTTTETLNLGDVIKVYASPNIKELDFSLMADRISEIDISKCNSSILGTKLKKLVIGSDTKINTTLRNISGLSQAVNLEYLDVRNMQIMNAIDLTSLKRLKTFYAGGSSLNAIDFADYSQLRTVEFPNSIQEITIQNQLYLETIIHNSLNSVSTISITNCPNLNISFNTLFQWSAQAVDKENLSLTIDNVNWSEISASNLIAFKDNIPDFNIAGVITLTDNVTAAQINSISDAFGAEVFDKNNSLHIIAKGVFISGPSTIKAGTSATFMPIVTGEVVGDPIVKFLSLPSYCHWDDNSKTLIVDRVFTGTTFIVSTMAIIENSLVESAPLTVTIIPLIDINSISINGPATLINSSDYILNLNPAGVEANYTVTWTFNGAAITNQTVEIVKVDDLKYTINKLLIPEEDEDATIIAALISESGATRTASLDISVSSLVQPEWNGNIQLEVIASKYNYEDPSIGFSISATIPAIIHWGDGTTDNINIGENKLMHLYPGITDNTRKFIEISNCTGITSLSLVALSNGNIISSRTDSLVAFWSVGTSVLQNIRLNSVNLLAVGSDIFKNEYNRTDYTSCFENCTRLQSLPDDIFQGLKNIESISRLFRNCRSLTHIPASFKDIRYNNSSTYGVYLSQAFSYCSSLTTLIDGMFDNITQIANGASIFKYCTSLQEIPAGLFRNFQPHKVPQIFVGCTSLRHFADDLTAPISQTSAVSIPSLYTECSNITDTITREVLGTNQLVSPYMIETNINIINSPFYGCSSISSVSPDLFSGSTYIEIPGMFCGTGLKKIPENLFAGVAQIRANSLFENTNIKKVPLNLVDDQPANGKNESWFKDCSNLEVGVLFDIAPEHNLLGWFYGCRNMTTLIIKRSDIIIYSSTLLSQFPRLHEIYVKDDQVEAYKTATGWVEVADMIFPLSTYVEEDEEE